MSDTKTAEARPHVGLFFECCRIYIRAYRQRNETCYRARCPSCLKSIVLQVGEGGTDARQFRVS